MIIIETNRIHAIYVRENRRTRWEYAEYCGRWETVERAVEEATKRYGDRPFEYLIVTLGGDEEVTGFVNWER